MEKKITKMARYQKHMLAFTLKFSSTGKFIMFLTCLF